VAEEERADGDEPDAPFWVLRLINALKGKWASVTGIKQGISDLLRAATGACNLWDKLSGGVSGARSAVVNGIFNGLQLLAENAGKAVTVGILLVLACSKWARMGARLLLDAFAAVLDYIDLLPEALRSVFRFLTLPVTLMQKSWQSGEPVPESDFTAHSQMGPGVDGKSVLITLALLVGAPAATIATVTAASRSGLSIARGLETATDGLAWLASHLPEKTKAYLSSIGMYTEKGFVSEDFAELMAHCRQLIGRARHEKYVMDEPGFAGDFLRHYQRLDTTWHDELRVCAYNSPLRAVVLGVLNAMTAMAPEANARFEARDHVEGVGIYIWGLPGSGKSVFVTDLTNALAPQGYTQSAAAYPYNPTEDGRPEGYHGQYSFVVEEFGGDPKVDAITAGLFVKCISQAQTTLPMAKINEKGRRFTSKYWVFVSNFKPDRQYIPNAHAFQRRLVENTWEASLVPGFAIEGQPTVLDATKVTGMSIEERAQYPHLRFRKWVRMNKPRNGQPMMCVDNTRWYTAQDIVMHAKATALARAGSSKDSGAVTAAFRRAADAIDPLQLAAFPGVAVAQAKRLRPDKSLAAPYCPPLPPLDEFRMRATAASKNQHWTDYLNYAGLTTDQLRELSAFKRPGCKKANELARDLVLSDASLTAASLNYRMGLDLRKGRRPPSLWRWFHETQAPGYYPRVLDPHREREALGILERAHHDHVMFNLGTERCDCGRSDVPVFECVACVKTRCANCAPIPESKVAHGLLCDHAESPLDEVFDSPNDDLPARPTPVQDKHDRLRVRNAERLARKKAKGARLPTPADSPPAVSSAGSSSYHTPFADEEEDLSLWDSTGQADTWPASVLLGGPIDPDEPATISGSDSQSELGEAYYKSAPPFRFTVRVKGYAAWLAGEINRVVHTKAGVTLSIIAGACAIVGLVATVYRLVDDVRGVTHDADSQGRKKYNKRVRRGGRYRREHEDQQRDHDDSSNVVLTNFRGDAIGQGLTAGQAQQLSQAGSTLERLQANVVWVVAEGMKQYGFVPSGRLLLTNAHFFIGDRELVDGSDLTIRYMRGDVVVTHTEPFERARLDVRVSRGVPSEDLAIYRLRDELPPFADVTRHVATGVPTQESIDGAVILRPNDAILATEIGVDNSPTFWKSGAVSYGTVDRKGVPTTYLVYEQQYAGLCGSPVALLVGSKVVIAGIHGAARRRRADGQVRGVAIPVTRMWLSASDATPQTLMSGLDSERRLVELAECYVQHGFLRGHRVPQPSQSRLEHSLIYDCFEPTHGIALLGREDDERSHLTPTDLLVKGLNEFAGSQMQFDDDLMGECVAGMYDHYRGAFHPSQLELKEPLLSLHECLNGNEGLGLPRINVATSPGYPLTAEVPRDQRGTGKRPFLIIEDDGTIALGPRAAQLQAEMEESLALGTVPDWHLGIVSLKDEKRPLRKIEAEQTRILKILPLANILAFRKYFGAVYSWMQLGDNECMIGMNVSSGDWEHMVQRLMQVGSQGSDGDFKCFQQYLVRRIAVLILDRFIEPFYRDFGGWTQEAADARRVLYLETNALKLLISGFVVTQTACNPSGKFGTSEDNCLLAGMLLRYVYLLCCRALGRDAWASMTHFERWVRLAVYGDDHMVAVAPELHDVFNFTTIQACMQGELCIKYTPACKTDEGVPLKSVYDLEFLKFRSRVDNLVPGVSIYGYPRLEDLIPTVQIVARGVKGALEDNVDASLRRAFGLGRAEFERIRTLFVKACATKRLNITPISWGACVNLWHAGELEESDNLYDDPCSWIPHVPGKPLPDVLAQLSLAREVHAARACHEAHAQAEAVSWVDHPMHDSWPQGAAISAVSKKARNVTSAALDTVDFAAGKASELGLHDYPVVGLEGLPVVRHALPDFALVHNVGAARILGALAKPTQVLGAGDYGHGRGDATLAFLFERPSLLATARWSEVDAPGQVLYDGSLTIAPLYSQLGAGEFTQPTSMGYAAFPFEFWRLGAGGYFEYTVEIVGSKFHTGRYAFLTSYLRGVPASLSDQLGQYAVVEDYTAEEVTRSFRVPWECTLEWLRTPDLYDDFDPTVNSFGRFAITIVNSLRSPSGSVAPEVELNIYVRAVGVEVRCPRPTAPTANVSDFTAVAQSGMLVDESMPQLGVDVPPAAELGITHVARPAAVAHEETLDILDLCKRSFCVDASLAAGHTLVDTGSLVGQRLGNNSAGHVTYWGFAYRFWAGSQVVTALGKATSEMTFVPKPGLASSATAIDRWASSSGPSGMGPYARGTEQARFLQCQAPFNNEHRVLAVPIAASDLERTQTSFGTFVIKSTGDADGRLVARMGDDFTMGRLFRLPTFRRFAPPPSSEFEAKAQSGVDFDGGVEQKAMDPAGNGGHATSATDEAVHTYKQIMAIPRHVTTITWPSTAPRGTVLFAETAPWAFARNTHLLALASFATFTPLVQQFRVVAQSQGFQQGQLIIAYFPLVNAAEAAVLGTSRQNLLMNPHIMIQAGSTREATLEVPYEHFLDRLDPSRQGDFRHYTGTLVVSVFNELRVGADAVGEAGVVSMSLFWSAPSCDFAVIEADPISAQQAVLNARRAPDGSIWEQL
jgi:hypothetical protein